MFFLFLLLAFFIIIFLILMCLTIQIQLENVYVTNISISKKWLQPNYKIYICLFLFGKFKVFRIKITEKLLQKIKWQDKVRRLEIKLINDRKNFDKNFIKIIKNIKIQAEKLEIKITIGLENVAWTAFAIPILSTILAILIRPVWNNNKKQCFKIQPIYQDKNILNLEVEGIFRVKMIHIMHIIYILIKKRRSDKNVRTSNRRTYGYSYE